MSNDGIGSEHGFDRDVAIVGGGPAGCSAGVFCARAGLDVAVFDRGRSSLKQCAYLENYLGFPAGIGIEAFYELMHDHAETAGCDIVPDLVEDVQRVDRGDRAVDADVENRVDADDDTVGFRVVPQEGDPVTARRVVAATRYDGEYMRGLDDDEAMFETVDHDGEVTEQFAEGYADHDGSTPVEGLYVATPSAEDEQAIVAAGRGARVGRRVVADARRDDGWWDAVVGRVDWMRREAELDDEWADRDRWVEWFDDYYGDDAPADPGDERFERVREAAIDHSFESYLSQDEIAEREARWQERLLDAVDDDHILERAEAIRGDRERATDD